MNMRTKDIVKIVIQLNRASHFITIITVVVFKGVKQSMNVFKTEYTCDNCKKCGHHSLAVTTLLDNTSECTLRR
jgi:hypothetical protein